MQKHEQAPPALLVLQRTQRSTNDIVSAAKAYASIRCQLEAKLRKTLAGANYLQERTILSGARQALLAPAPLFRVVAGVQECTTLDPNYEPRKSSIHALIFTGCTRTFGGQSGLIGPTVEYDYSHQTFTNENVESHRCFRPGMRL